MIKHTQGNLFDSDAEAVMNTVNTVGVMGKGIALRFKRAFPENFRAYERACKQGEVKLGRMFVHETQTLHGPRFIINFPTESHWKASSRLEDIHSGLQSLTKTIRGLRSNQSPFRPWVAALAAGIGPMSAR